MTERGSLPLTEDALHRGHSSANSTVPAPTPLSQIPVDHAVGTRGPSSPAKNSSRSSVWDLQPPQGWWLHPLCAREPTGSCPAALGSPAAAAPSACGGWQGELGCLYLPTAPWELQSALGTRAWCSSSPSASWAAPLCSWPPWLGLKVRETGRSAPLRPSFCGPPLLHCCSSPR